MQISKEIWRDIQMFHKHKFNYRTNLLWCECGATKQLPCLHDWHIHSDKMVTLTNHLGSVEQNQQILKCITCGMLKSVNTTTGKIRNTNEKV